MEVVESDFDNFNIKKLDDTDMIVLGFSATEINVEKIISKVQQIAAESSIPILVLISSSDNVISNLIETSTHSICLSKPFTFHALEHAIQETMDEEFSIGSKNERIPSSIEPSLQLANYRILVADDNPINLQLITTLLHQRGATITQANDGIEAVEFACNNEYDMILMDVHMPNLNGLQAARKIRQYESDKSRHTPILALTADVMPDTKKNVTTSGMDDYLVKPVDEPTLIDIISFHLTGSTLSTVEQIPTLDQPSGTDKSNNVRDRQQAILVTGGNTKLAQELYEKFCQDLVQQTESIRQHATAGEWGQLRETAHRLSGSAALCAAISLRQVTKEIEIADIDKQEDSIVTLMARLTEEVKSVLDDTETTVDL